MNSSPYQRNATFPRALLPEASEDHFGSGIAKLLDEAVEDIPVHICERLQQARELALACGRGAKAHPRS